MKTSIPVKYIAPGIEIFLSTMSDPMLASSNLEDTSSESFQDEEDYEPIW